MRKNKYAMIASAVLLFAAAVGIGVSASSNYGTKNDPLITMSYLDEVFMAEIIAQAEENAATAAEELAKKFNDALAASGKTPESYKVVELAQGQTLRGSVGCEILLRIGTANCKATSSPGLVDSTSGGSIDNGAALTKNHLYLVTIDGGGITATAGVVKVVVRGAYTVA